MCYIECMIIDGKKIAEEILAELKQKSRPKKFLAALLVGEDPASVSFLRIKEKVAKELGIEFQLHTFSKSVSRDILRRSLDKIAEKKMCGGIIIQLPLPPQINKHYILNAIPREKDVDVLSERALGSFYTERSAILPPSVGALVKILDRSLITPQGDDMELAGWFIENKKIAVVGLGFLVGKPIATWLVGKAKEAHFLDKGSDLSVLKDMDIVILGTGQPHLINSKMLKQDALVIDFGYSKEGKKIVGDFNPIHAPETLSYTPTPGGTGPILVAQLFENFYTLNK